MASSSSEHAAKPEDTGGGETSEARPPPPSTGADQLLLYRGLKKAKKERGCTAKERISRMAPCTAGKRSSIYRGVTRYSDCRTWGVRLPFFCLYFVIGTGGGYFMVDEFNFV